ncbi:MAG: response regulator [Campylobacterota bacterium]|nr:response regulator [Campylobacterota bacterium]
MANILVVDDVKIMRLTIKRHLEDMGHTVVAEAGNGHEAISQYEIFQPDLVTMDITMPEINGIGNGIDALEKIKEFDSDAKIIMLTSHGEQKLVIEAISKGSKGYVLKPVTKDKLSDVLGKIDL